MDSVGAHIGFDSVKATGADQLACRIRRNRLGIGIVEARNTSPQAQVDLLAAPGSYIADARTLNPRPLIAAQIRLCRGGEDCGEDWRKELIFNARARP